MPLTIESEPLRLLAQSLRDRRVQRGTIRDRYRRLFDPIERHSSASRGGRFAGNPQRRRHRSSVANGKLD